MGTLKATNQDGNIVELFCGSPLLVGKTFLDTHGDEYLLIDVLVKYLDNDITYDILCLNISEFFKKIDPINVEFISKDN